MKKSSKILSLFLAIVMAVTCAGFSTTAFAADQSQCATVALDVTYRNSLVAPAVNQINQIRAGKGYFNLTVDANLTAVAKQRAAEIAVFKDYDNDTLPNGDPITTYIPGYNVTEATAFSSVSANFESIVNALYMFEYSSTAMFQSVGIGIAAIGDYSLIYIIASLNPATAVYTNYADESTVAYVNTLLSNIQCSLDFKSDEKYFRYNATVEAYCPNGYIRYIKLPISQFNISSSNSKVMKVKGTNIYPKKNGAFTITATSIYSPNLIASVSNVVDLFNNVKVKNVSAKSSKKKTITVKWSYSISDIGGYEIQYSTSKKFPKKSTKTAIVKGKKKISKTISKLKSKKTYYVRVRGYVNQGDGEKCYTGWSKTIRVKVK